MYGIFKGFVEHGQRACYILKVLIHENRYKIDPFVLNTLNDLLANQQKISIKAVIASFINYAEQNSNKWEDDIMLEKNFRKKFVI